MESPLPLTAVHPKGFRPSGTLRVPARTLSSSTTGSLVPHVPKQQFGALKVSHGRLGLGLNQVCSFSQLRLLMQVKPPL